MSEILEVKTVAMARRMSLIKWKKVKVLSGRVFNELDSACGFCYLGRSRALSERDGKDSDNLPFIEKCDHCGVNKRCDKILKKGNNIEEKLTELIDKTITFLEDMDVTEK